MKLHFVQCQYRPVSCPDCGVMMGYIVMNNSHDPCPKKQVQCPNNGCEAKITHLELFEHLKMCEFSVMDCPITGCDVHLLKKDLMNHMETSVVTHQLTINNCMKALEKKHTVELEHAREGLRKELEGKMTNIMKELLGRLDELQSKVEGLKGDQLKLNESVDNMKRVEYFIDGLMKIADKVKVENWRLYLHTIAEFSTQLNPAHPVIVSIQNYTAKLELSLKPGSVSFRTAQFYSKRGYRMYLNINPSSQGTHKGKYLAVFVNITKGDKDDQLSWPYEGKIKILLLNQLYNNDHHIYRKEYFLSRRNPDVKDHCIAKPVTGSNQGWGYTDFILSENLKKSDMTPHTQYLVNDSLYFEVYAD